MKTRIEKLYLFWCALFVLTIIVIIALGFTGCAWPGVDNTNRDRHPGVPVDEHPFKPGDKP